MTVLIAGSHGFIGFSLARRLLDAGHSVIGIDKKKDAVSPKGARVDILAAYKNYRFFDHNLSDNSSTHELFAKEQFEHAVFLAGQYSQHHSEQHTHSCLEGNVVGLTNFFEAAARKKLPRVVYASSTFVQDGVLPTTMYGATKQWAELAASVYSAQHNMETIGLRFGSVYGPYIRPDVGVAHAAKGLFKHKPIDISRGGYTYKVAFVYIDDAVECLVRCIERPAFKRYQVLTCVAEDEIRDMVQMLECMERHTGGRAKKLGQRAPEQAPTIPTVFCAAMRESIGYAPTTKMEEGIKKFVEWYATGT